MIPASEVKEAADNLLGTWNDLRETPLGGRGHLVDSVFEAMVLLRKIAEEGVEGE